MVPITDNQQKKDQLDGEQSQSKLSASRRREKRATDKQKINPNDN